MEATYPGARMRPDKDYEPGPPDTDGPLYRVRSYADAVRVLTADGAPEGPDGTGGGVTQDYRWQYACLQAAGVEGIPDSLADVHTIFKFAWAQEGSCPAPGLGPGKHDLMTGLVSKYFSKRAVDDATGAFREIADRLLAGLMPGRHGVLDAAKYSRRLAMQASAHLMGLPLAPADEERIGEIFDGFTSLPTVAGLPSADPEEDKFFGTLMAAAEGGMAAEIRAHPGLDESERIAMIRGALYAGTDTTGGTLTTLLGLLSLRENARYVKALREANSSGRRAKLLRRYVLETGRHDPTFPQIPASTWKPLELPSNVTIPAGHPVLVVVTAVNRDPGIAPDAPDEWRPDLHRHRSIGWGRGLHACTGEYMALIVDAIGTAAAMEATASLELARWRSDSRLVTSIDEAGLTYRKAA